jgi:Flp pilus assembly protein TadD
LGPNYPQVHRRLGVALAKTGDLRGAAQELLQELNTYPKDALTHYEYARVLDQMGELPKAREHYFMAIQLRPNFTSAINDLGILLARIGDPDSTAAAFRCFLQAIEIDPTFADSYYNLGVWYIGKGDLQNAQACLEETLRLDWEHPHAPAALNSVRQAMSTPPK